MIKAILFDIDNTLLSFDEFVKETMRIGFDEFGIGTYKDEMFNIFNNINSGLWEEIERGKLNLAELQKKRWNMIFKRLGISADGILFEKYFRERLFESAIVEHGAIELLRYLHGKYILCVASNGPFLQQVNRLKLGGMLKYFSDLFISEEIGCSKPSEAFFKACINRLNLKSNSVINPHEIMIVGDSLSSDILGGIQSGIKTCFYNPKKKEIPNEIKPDYQAASLEEIKGIL